MMNKIIIKSVFFTSVMIAGYINIDMAESRNITPVGIQENLGDIIENCESKYGRESCRSVTLFSIQEMPSEAYVNDESPLPRSLKSFSNRQSLRERPYPCHHDDFEAWISKNTARSNGRNIVILDRLPLDLNNCMAFESPLRANLRIVGFWNGKIVSVFKLKSDSETDLVVSARFYHHESDLESRIVGFGKLSFENVLNEIEDILKFFWVIAKQNQSQIPKISELSIPYPPSIEN